MSSEHRLLLQENLSDRRFRMASAILNAYELDPSALDEINQELHSDSIESEEIENLEQVSLEDFLEDQGC